MCNFKTSHFFGIKSHFSYATEFISEKFQDTSVCQTLKQCLNDHVQFFRSLEKNAPLLCLPFRRKKSKVHGVRSGLYGACGYSSKPRKSISKVIISLTVWHTGLSWCRITLSNGKLERFFRKAGTRTLLRTWNTRKQAEIFSRVFFCNNLIFIIFSFNFCVSFKDMLSFSFLSKCFSN